MNQLTPSDHLLVAVEKALQIAPGNSITPETVVGDWANRLCEFGGLLRSGGWDRDLKDVTVGRPMDHTAIEALRCACRSANQGTDSSEYQALVKVLSGILRGGRADHERFHDAVIRVIQRITAYGW